MSQAREPLTLRKLDKEKKVQLEAAPSGHIFTPHISASVSTKPCRDTPDSGSPVAASHPQASTAPVDEEGVRSEAR